MVYFFGQFAYQFFESCYFFRCAQNGVANAAFVFEVSYNVILRVWVFLNSFRCHRLSKLSVVQTGKVAVNFLLEIWVAGAGAGFRYSSEGKTARVFCHCLANFLVEVLNAVAIRIFIHLAHIFFLCVVVIASIRVLCGHSS